MNILQGAHPTIRGASHTVLMRWLEDANRAAIGAMLRGLPEAGRLNELADALHEEAVRRGILEIDPTIEAAA